MKKLFLGLVLCFLFIFSACKERPKDYQIYSVKNEADLKELMKTTNYDRNYYEKGGDMTPEGPDQDVDEPSSQNSYSKTNVQVEGVDEGDIVKTDGNRIYIASYKTFKIVDVNEGKMELIFETKTKENSYYFELYVTARYAIVIGSSYSYGLYDRLYSGNTQNLTVDIYDIRTSDITLVKNLSMSGYYNTSRLIEDKLYLVANYCVNDLDKTLRPVFTDGVNQSSPDYQDIKYIGSLANNFYTIFASISLTEEITVNYDSYLGFWGGTLYINKESIYNATHDYNNNKTDIIRYLINSETNHIEIKGCINVPGITGNQFFMDEYNGYFRVVTTQNIWSFSEIAETNLNHLYIYKLDDQSKSGFTLVGSLTKGIGKPGERVMSVRFNNDEVSVVTFRQIDPLYIIDLSEPTKPIIVGELEIPGYSSYQHHWDDNTIVGIGFNIENNMSNGIKVSLFDKTNPKQMVEVANLVFPGYAEATHNHKAILIDKEHNIFGFSVNEYNGMGNYAYYNPVYYLIKVDLTSEEALTVVGKISSSPQQGITIEYNYNAFCQVVRMININEYYYSISHGDIKSFTFIDGKLTLVNRLEIQPYIKSDYWNYQ